MSSERWQVNYDGNLDWKEAVSSSRNKSNTGKLELLKELFERDGWSCKILGRESKFTKVELTNSISNEIKEYNVALINVVNDTRSNSDRKDSPSSLEKRIQGGGLYEVSCSNKLIFGLYVIEDNEDIDDSIIVSLPEEILTAGENRAYRVNTKEIQPARIVGLYVDRNSAYDAVIFKPENVHMYLKNMDILHRSKNASNQESVITEEETINESVYIGKPYNRIFFGAPGTGKSYKINKERKQYFPKENQFDRVTFHPNYSYSHFVGTYKPTPMENDEKVITYKFVPGPFLKLWVKSKRSMHNGDGNNYLLIIEEINRANAAGVFGDIFQLLDRKEGVSEYSISVSEDIKRYLKNEFSKSIPENDWFNQLSEEEQEDHISSMKLYPNMYIWCTMNSADQGVFPLDTAFKRRWNFKYIGLNKSEDKNDKDVVLANGKTIAWNSLRRTINEKLGKMNFNEDKMVGPFFLNEDDLVNNFDTAFKSKLLMYLYEDIIKHKRDDFFIKDMDTYSKLLETYDSGEEIFNFELNYKIETMDYGTVTNEPAQLKSEKKEEQMNEEIIKATNITGNNSVE